MRWIWRWGDRVDLVIGIAAVIGVVGYVAAAIVLNGVGFPLDDAWIHQVYGRNLGTHGEWAFLPGQPSAASTAPLFTGLLAIGYALHIPFFVWTFALGALTLAAGGWVGRRIGTLAFPMFPSAGAWTGLAIVTAWHMVWAAASGMETMLFITLSLALVWQAWRAVLQQEGWSLNALLRHGALIGILGGVLTLTRPEGMGLLGLTAVTSLASWPGIANRTAPRRAAVWSVGLGVAWLVIALPYFAVNYHLGHALLPDTAAAKQAEYAAVVSQWSLPTRYGKLLLPLLAGGAILLVPGICVGVANVVRRALSQRSVYLLLPLLWVVADLTAYALRLPVNYQHGRYVMPVLPHLMIYGVGGMLLMLKSGRAKPVRRVLTRSLALAAVGATLGFWYIGAQQYARDVRIINTEMVTTAKWIKANLPPDEVLAVHDIGAVGYYAPRSIFDLAGLISPEVVPIIRDPESLMQIMCERKIQYLMVLPEHRPARENDPRMGAAPIFKTDTPYAVEAGGGNMAVYRLNWPSSCD